MHDAPIIVPPGRLSADALQGLIEEFVTREGTDYGHEEHSFAQKCQQVRRQLDRGEVVIAFDPESESTNLVPKRELR